jgi:hypothetical protein
MTLGRSGARRRHPGRRRHGHDREHQLPPGAGQGGRAGDPRRRAADRRSGFVTLLCICIVFVPMFQLGGVAGYLFRPLAEAVVFALIGSFILSRTLVPTMANYLMRGIRALDTRRWSMTAHARPATRNPLKRFQQGFERGSSVSATLPLAAGAGAGDPRPSSIGFIAVSCLLRPGAVPRREFLSRGRFRPDPDACARAARHAHRGNRAAVRPQVEQTVRRTIPPDQLDNIVDNIGLPFSGINMAYRTPARSARRTATR